MNPSFDIKSTAAANDKHLFVFAGRQGIAFAMLDRQQDMFTGVTVYHFASGATDAEYQISLQEVLENESMAKQFSSKTDIIWCTGESIITPQSFFNREVSGSMLDLVFGDAGGTAVKNELLLKHHAYNVYRLDAATEKLIAATFPGAVQSHQSSLLVNFESGKKDLLYCHFFPGSFTVLLRKEHRLQAIQSFDYSTPDDAAYHLLNMCRQFDTYAAETIITASGTIDETSNLYRELYKYFLNIEFPELPDRFSYSDEIKTYPPHYFSHLFATAACVL